MTAADLINRALKLIGVLADGETAQTTETTDALADLNDLLDAWKAEELTIFTQGHNTYSLVAGQQTYTIGPSGNFNQERPAWIDRVVIVSLNNPSQPLDLPCDMLDDDQWAAIPVKNIQSTLPRKVHYHPKYPLGELDYWPVPSVSSVSTTIYAPANPVTLPLASGDTISLPPGYNRALRYALAVELAPSYGVQLNGAIVMGANESKAAIKRLNADHALLRVDPALVTTSRGRFNWLTGDTT